MATYLRTIKIPQKYFADLIDNIVTKGGSVNTKSTRIYNEPYALISLVSSKPIVLSRASVIAVERNSSAAVATAVVHAKVFASDLDLQGFISYDWSDTTLTTSGDEYSVDVTLTDKDGIAVTETITIHVVDTLKPVITATATVSVAYADIAAWTPTATATDNVSDNITSDIVFTYFEADGTTTIANLAAFRTYLDNSAAGGIVGVIKCNVTDADNNVADTKTITVTAGAASEV
jgi:hypothetical protein